MEDKDICTGIVLDKKVLPDGTVMLLVEDQYTEELIWIDEKDVIEKLPFN